MNIETFIQKVKELNIEVDEEKLTKLNDYYNLLIEWNEKINLTSILLKEEVYLKHFYDSLTISKVIDLKSVKNLCDVGTGAGFPGIVLKIFYPHLEITFLDALNKRIEFLKLVCEKLSLKNVTFVHSRAEDFAKKNREVYDVVTTRAVASLPVLLEYCVPLVKQQGYFIAMKGKNSEIDLCKNAFSLLNLKIEKNLKFNLPFEESERTLIKLLKLKKTNLKYPRKFGEIKRNPL